MLKWRYPILQDLDFVFEEGEREKMYSKLAIKLNKTRSELEALFADLQLH